MSQPTNRGYVLGCPVDRIAAEDLRKRLPAIASGGTLTHLVTLNPEQVMCARSDASVRRIIERAEIVTADGVGITLAIRLRGEEPPDRVTGVEIVEWIADLGLPVYFLGGAEGVGELATARLRDRFPAVNVAGYWAGGTPAPADDDAAIERIAASGASVVCVAYGAPAQLRWIERNRPRLLDAGVRLAIGIGGSLDYHAGAVQRAPRIVRRLGLEWLARLIREPWRWRRQTVLPVYAILAFGEAARTRLGRR